MVKFEKYKKWSNDGDNEFRPFINYTVTKRKDKTRSIRQLLLILAYTAFVALYCVLFFTIIKIPMMGALVPLLLWIIIYFTWWLTKLEYEYKIVSGIMTAREIYGERYSKVLCEFRLSEVLSLAPVDMTDGELLASVMPDKKYFCVSSESAENTYVAIFEENGVRSAVYFETTEQVLAVIKKYTSKIIIR